MIVLIDNYDSFVYNLARYLERLGQTTRVVRNDAISVEELRAWEPDAVVLSPGPCTPLEAGICLALVEQLHRSLPILGICLGHQAIAHALGGQIIRAPQPMHGRSSPIQHEGIGLFSGLPSPLTVGRYHSLIVDRTTLPSMLSITASLEDGTIMALQHREYPVFGLQFHPESVLTAHGYAMLANFLRIVGLATLSVPGNEVRSSSPMQTDAPSPELTFDPSQVPEAWMAHQSLRPHQPYFSHDADSSCTPEPRPEA